jgi:hypothetical protein
MWLLKMYFMSKNETCGTADLRLARDHFTLQSESINKHCPSQGILKEYAKMAEMADLSLHVIPQQD